MITLCLRTNCNLKQKSNFCFANVYCWAGNKRKKIILQSYLGQRQQRILELAFIIRSMGKCFNDYSIAEERHQDQGNREKKAFNWVIAYRFIGLVYYWGQKHGSRLKGMGWELKCWSKDRRQRERNWTWHGLLKSQHPSSVTNLFQVHIY